MAADDQLDVLVVCTANVCRSPMAAALLDHHARQAGLPLRVTSAGTQAGRVPVDPVAVKVLAERGLDISAHVPRRVSAPLLQTDGAGLVLTMTRAHLRDVAVTDRGAFARTMTLREAVRRLGTVGLGGDAPARIAGAAATRRPGDLMGHDPADDVDDPYGLGVAAVRATADELARLTEHLVRLLLAR